MDPIEERLGRLFRARREARVRRGAEEAPVRRRGGENAGGRSGGEELAAGWSHTGLVGASIPKVAGAGRIRHRARGRRSLLRDLPPDLTAAVRGGVNVRVRLSRDQEFLEGV